MNIVVAMSVSFRIIDSRVFVFTLNDEFYLIKKHNIILFNINLFIYNKFVFYINSRNMSHALVKPNVFYVIKFTFAELKKYFK